MGSAHWLLSDHGAHGRWHREMKPRANGRSGSVVAQGGPRDWPSSSTLQLPDEPPVGLKEEAPQTVVGTQS